MDFDLDDPLGDLLSDGSNDSFFGTPKKPTTTKKPSTQTSTDTTSKSKVADLFGFDDEKTTKSIESATKSSYDLISKSAQSTSQSLEPNKTPIKETINSAINSQSTKKPTALNQSSGGRTTETSGKTIESNRNANEKTRAMKKEPDDDSDDFLNELGFDPKNPKGNISKKSNILNDILNFSKPEPISKTTNMPSSTPKSTPKSNSIEADMPNRTANRYSPSLGRPRNAPGSSSTPDPLGLFSTPSKTIQEPKKDESNTSTTRSKASKKAAVDWLGLDDDKDEKPKKSNPIESETGRTKAESPKPKTTHYDTNSTPKPIQSEFIPVTLPIMTSTAVPTTATDISNNLNLMTIASLEKEQALKSIQQQQTQLQLAVQMKQQENMLHDMHLKQQSLIKQQENQFNDLLQRQISRQSQLEAQIQQQQDQINAYINILMNQPNIGLASTRISSIDDDDHSKSQHKEEEIDGSRQHAIELEADVKRLELEKLRLEDTVQSVQTSHEQELELLHTSHKKQIELLKGNLESVEKRLREEIKSMETYYLNKISALETDVERQQHKYEEHIEKLTTDYEKQIERLRNNYEHDLEALKNDQRSTIESIRQSKLLEFAAVQESGSYLHTLKSASDNLEHATDNLQSMRTNIDSTIERIHAEKQVHLEAKEKRLNEQQKSIEKTIERTEEERTRLMELVKSLEIKLNSVEQSANEEQWNFRQKSASLEAERVSFERERTFTREKLASEEKKIQEMKDMHFIEHKRLMDLLDAEREQILIEKTKLETMERIKPTSYPSIGKRHTELDAAIKIAQDAAKSADVELGKHVEQQRQLELKKRELLEKETKLQTQQNELEFRINEAKDQKQIAEHATKACKNLEQKLLIKLQNLQQNYIELTEREAKLSQAKMELGKERMELEGLRQQLRQSKCSLCRICAKNHEISEMDPLKDIDANDKPLTKFDIYASNSFDGLQQRLSSVEAMIDDVIITVPQSPKHRHLFHLNANETSQSNAHSKTVIDPF